jgi:hypothetical protein
LHRLIAPALPGAFLPSITSSARASTVARKCELLHSFAAKGSRTII